MKQPISAMDYGTGAVGNGLNNNGVIDFIITNDKVAMLAPPLEASTPTPFIKERGFFYVLSNKYYGVCAT